MKRDVELAESLKAPDADTQELVQLMQRILKLSQKADNPGVAYRNLDTIHALAESLSEKLGFELPEEE